MSRSSYDEIDEAELEKVYLTFDDVQLGTDSRSTVIF